MRVLVIGGTGVIGRRALRRLARRHEVTAVARDASGERAVAERGARPLRGDILEPATLEAALAGAEVVVNLASAIPRSARPAPEQWAVNDRVRREGTGNLLAAGAQAGVLHYVHTSVYLVYGDDAGQEPVDEAASLRPGPALVSAVDAEQAVRAAGLAWTILRPGWLYDAGAWHTEELLRQVRAGQAAVADGPPAWRSPVHADDVARAVELAVDARPAGEVFNVADDLPLPEAELLDGLAELVGAPRPARVPAARTPARRSVRLSTGRIRARLGFAPRYADWRAGFEAVLAER